MVACILIIVAAIEVVVADCIKCCSEKSPSSRRLWPEKACILFVHGLAFLADTHTNVARLLARFGRDR